MSNVTHRIILGLFLGSLLNLIAHAAYAGGEMHPRESEIVTYSAECALAIAVAVEDYRSWFLERSGDNEGFMQHFQASFGIVECIESAQEVRVHILPKQEVRRGGGVSYWIDRNDLSVVKRIFER